MLIKIVGARKLNFNGQDGNSVKGVQYAYIYKDSRIDGYWIDKFFCSDSRTDVPKIVIGSEYDVQCYFKSDKLDLSTLSLI